MTRIEVSLRDIHTRKAKRYWHRDTPERRRDSLEDYTDLVTVLGWGDPSGTYKAHGEVTVRL